MQRLVRGLILGCMLLYGVASASAGPSKMRRTPFPAFSGPCRIIVRSRLWRP